MGTPLIDRRPAGPGTRVLDLLAHVPMFRGLPPADLTRIAAGTTTVHADRGQVLFQRGDPCSGFHYVAFGQVKLALSTPAGAEKVIEILGPGRTFGEAVMFTGGIYPVSATALADSLLLFYLFWEAALVAVYFWIGLHGRRGRGDAGRAVAYPVLLRFVLFTLAGSLPMLASIAAVCAANFRDPGLQGLAATVARLPEGTRGWVGGGVHHEEHTVGAGHFRCGAADPFAFDVVVGVAQACGIEHVQGQAVDVYAFAQHVARGARDGGDDGRVVPREAIQQAGLAGVGPPGQHHGETVAQQPSLAGRRRHRVEVRAHGS